MAPMFSLLSYDNYKDEEGKIEKTFDKVKTATHGADVLAYLQNKKIL